jgi:hypothetical protein
LHRTNANRENRPGPEISASGTDNPVCLWSFYILAGKGKEKGKGKGKSGTSMIGICQGEMQIS